MLENGCDSVSGLKWYRGYEKHITNLFQEESNKIEKDGRIEKTSQGYMVAAIESFLQSTSNLSSNSNSEILLKIFRLADRGYGDFDQMLKAGPGIPNKSKSFFGWIPWKFAGKRSSSDEAIYQLYEELGIYKELCNIFLPMLEDINNELITVDEGIFRMWNAISPDAKKYGNFLKDTFDYERGTFITMMAMEGVEPKSILQLPLVPFRWRVLNKNLTEDDDESDLDELILLNNALWLKLPNRQYNSTKIQILQINGVNAPLSILLDMSYRFSIQDAYCAIKRTAEIVKREEDTTYVYLDFSGPEGPLWWLLHLSTLTLASLRISSTGEHLLTVAEGAPPAPEALKCFAATIKNKTECNSARAEPESTNFTLISSKNFARELPEFLHFTSEVDIENHLLLNYSPLHQYAHRVSKNGIIYEYWKNNIRPSSKKEASIQAAALAADEEFLSLYGDPPNE